MVICPIALENLQTLDGFLTEKTLQDLATDESSTVDTTRLHLLLQLYYIAQSFRQHSRCFAHKKPEETIASYSVADVDSILIYTPSAEEDDGNGEWRQPTLLFNPCDFLLNASNAFKGDPNDDSLDGRDAAALSRWTGLILGDVLNSSFASVEEFMRSSTRHRKPRLDLRACDALRRLRGQVVDYEVFLSRASLLLELLAQSNQIRKCGGGGTDVEDEEENDVEQKRARFIRFCGVEEARLTGQLVRSLFRCMENDAETRGREERARLDFDSRLSLLSVTRNAQWLTRMPDDDLINDASVLKIFFQLME